MVKQKTPGILLMVGLIFVACGYRFAGGGSFPAGIRAVFVEVFENRTDQTGIEDTLTSDLIYEISRDTATYLASRDKAEGILSGAITALSTDTISWKGLNQAVERRLTARISLKLAKPSGKVVWSRDAVAGTETYLVSVDNQVTEKNKEEAIAVLFKRLSEIIYSQMTSDF